MPLVKDRLQLYGGGRRISDSRVNHHVMLHVHKDGTDAPTFEDVANNFVGEKEIRKQLFGKIFATDIYPKQVLCFVKVNTNGELKDRTKGVVDKCSDLTCTKEVRFNRYRSTTPRLIKANFLLPLGLDFAPVCH